MDASFAMMIDTARTLYEEWGAVHETFVLILSIAIHILDAKQSILARILHFPHLLHNIYVYFITQFYGKVFYSIVVVFWNAYAYVRWKGSKATAAVQVDKTKHTTCAFIMGVGCLGTLIWGFASNKYFHQTLSMSLWCDAFYAFFGLVEKWFMSHKKLERWLLAFLRYVIFAIACYYKGKMILTALHLILAVIAIYGQIKWVQSYQTRVKCLMPNK